MSNPIETGSRFLQGVAWGAGTALAMKFVGPHIQDWVASQLKGTQFDRPYSLVRRHIIEPSETRQNVSNETIPIAAEYVFRYGETARVQGSTKGAEASTDDALGFNKTTLYENSELLDRVSRNVSVQLRLAAYSNMVGGLLAGLLHSPESIGYTAGLTAITAFFNQSELSYNKLANEGYKMGANPQNP